MTSGAEGPARGVGEAMRALGWSAALDEALAPLGAVAGEVGRVRSQHRGGYEVETEAGVRLAAIEGKTMRGWQGAALPIVGDWVLVEVPSSGWSVVRAILPRRTRLARRAAGGGVEEQLLVANVDVGLIVTSLDGDLSVRRLERYTMMCHEGGVRPVIALSKADLTDDPAADIARARAAVPGVEIMPLSVPRGQGLDEVRALLAPGVTMVLLGSSGVGKSTLLNALLGRDEAITGAVKSDGRGRHTTTSRQLLLMPGGGVVIDTPGMRELGVLGDDLSFEAFGELDALVGSCRFSNCQHGTEPGCALRAAVASGQVPAERLVAYLTMRTETAWVERERATRARADERAQNHRGSRMARSSARPRGRLNRVQFGTWSARWASPGGRAVVRPPPTPPSLRSGGDHRRTPAPVGRAASRWPDAGRRTPLAARRTPHAGRRTPHAARRTPLAGRGWRPARSASDWRRGSPVVPS